LAETITCINFAKLLTLTKPILEMKTMTKMKTFISSTLLLLAVLLPATVAAYDLEVDGICYDVNGSEATVTYREMYYDHGAVPRYHSDYTGDVVIPATVTHDGITYRVTAIGHHAFNYCGVTGVTVPNTVTAIGHMAFSHCYQLTHVFLGISLTSIGGYAFEECRELTSVNIPNSLHAIDSGAFYDCTSLASVTMGNSVSSIGELAFDGCSGLSSISFPESLVSIGNGAFSRTAWYESQPVGLVYAGPVAYKYKGEMPQGTSIALKENTVAITDGAFYQCEGLTDIFIPNSVTTIGQAAFYGCTALETITIPSSVTTLACGALEECTGLTDVYCNIPDPAKVKKSNLFGSTVILSTSEGDYAGRTLHVPYGIAHLYKADEDWYPYFERIVDDLMTGDVDGNYSIGISDAVTLIDYLLSGKTTDINTVNADVDGDGIISIADVTAITDILLLFNF